MRIRIFVLLIISLITMLLSAKQFQIFDSAVIGPYRVLPQIDFNYNKNGLVTTPLDFSVFAQVAHFLKIKAH